MTSKYCQGELCGQCGKDAKHKISEVIFDDDPHPNRHELTVYVCGDCFMKIMNRTYFMVIDL